MPRYNPFSSWVSSDSDKDYNLDNCDSDMTKLSSILNHCKSYTTNELNKAISTLETSCDNSSNNQLSSLFLNIDGNKTNFDHFLVLLKGIKHM